MKVISGTSQLMVGMAIAFAGFTQIWAPWAWLSIVGACVSLMGTVMVITDSWRKAAKCLAHLQSCPCAAAVSRQNDSGSCGLD